MLDGIREDGFKVRDALAFMLDYDWNILDDFARAVGFDEVLKLRLLSIAKDTADGFLEFLHDILGHRNLSLS